MQSIELTLKPIVKNQQIQSIYIKQVIKGHSFKQDELFASLEKSLYGCLSNNYSKEDLKIKDDLGTIQFKIEDQKDIHYYYMMQDTIGNLVIEYQAEVFEMFNWPNPAYSLHHRNKGVTGYGATFLLIPEGTYLYDIQYDKSEIPNTFCACSQGLENVSKALTNQEVKETCFGLGVPYLYHQEDSYLHILYFEDDFKYFDEIKEKLTMYYDYMMHIFFGQKDPYFIFLYRKEKKFNITLTGTAEKHVCLMGYGDELIDSYKAIEPTLVHELVHNFIQLKDEQEAYHSIFDEGTADYYAAMIPYYLRMNTKEETVASINAMIRQYYSNPWKEKNLIYSYERSWTHAYACRIMYGKGIVLITGLEALLKQYHSKYTLIDYIVRLIKEQKEHKVGLDQFIQWIDQETERKAGLYFNSLVQGGKVMILDGLFEDYHVVEGAVAIEENGFDDRVAYLKPKKVINIQEESNAYKAGLRNGDIILSKLDEWSHGANEKKLAHLEIERDGKVIMISYLPRGKETYLYQYEK